MLVPQELYEVNIVNSTYNMRKQRTFPVRVGIPSDTDLPLHNQKMLYIYQTVILPRALSEALFIYKRIDHQIVGITSHVHKYMCNHVN